MRDLLQTMKIYLDTPGLACLFSINSPNFLRNKSLSGPKSIFNISIFFNKMFPYQVSHFTMGKLLQIQRIAVNEKIFYSCYSKSGIQSEIIFVKAVKSHS